MSVSVTLKSYFYEVLIPSSQKNTSSPIEDILHHVSISFMKKLALYKCFNPRTHTGCDPNSPFKSFIRFFISTITGGIFIPAPQKAESHIIYTDHQGIHKNRTGLLTSPKGKRRPVQISLFYIDSTVYSIIYTFIIAPLWFSFLANTSMEVPLSFLALYR